MSPGNGALHGMFTKSKTPNSKVFKKGWASKASKFRYWRYWGHFKKRKFAHAKRYCKKVSPLLLLSQHLYATRRNLSASSAPKSLRKRWFEQYPQSANCRQTIADIHGKKAAVDPCKNRRFLKSEVNGMSKNKFRIDLRPTH